MIVRRMLDNAAFKIYNHIFKYQRSFKYIQGKIISQILLILVKEATNFCVHDKVYIYYKERLNTI